MNQIKPLDQLLSIEADTHNQITKTVNKFGPQGSILYQLKEFSSSVHDFRRSGKGNIRHKLADIIMLNILGRASGCVGRAEIIEFGRYNLDKFRKMGMLRNGVPSEATLCRVDNGIDELAMADRMQRFVEAFHGGLLKNDHGKEIICVDGKAERGTVQDNGRNPDIVSAYSYTEGPELGHGWIETRTYSVFDGLGLMADKEKWGGGMTIIEYESDTFKKSSGVHTLEKRLYVSSLPTNTPALGALVRIHWAIESMHWLLDYNFLQDKVKRKSERAARNLDTIQRIVHSVFSIWKGLRKKRSDKKKGIAELMRYVSMNFTDFCASYTKNNEKLPDS